MSTSTMALQGSAANQPGHGPLSLLKRAATGVFRFFASLDRAVCAARDYERLSTLSNKQLVARGLDRAELSSAVFEHHFAKQGSK